MEKATTELQTVCRAEYRGVLTRIRRFILKIVGVNVKEDWNRSIENIFLSLIVGVWLTMIERMMDWLMSDWNEFERSIYKGMNVYFLFR